MPAFDLSRELSGDDPMKSGWQVISERSETSRRKGGPLGGKPSGVSLLLFLNLLCGCAYGPNNLNPTCIARCVTEYSEVKGNPALSTLTTTDGDMANTRTGGAVTATRSPTVTSSPTGTVTVTTTE